MGTTGNRSYALVVDLSWTIDDDRKPAVVELTGTIDLATTPQLRQLLTERAYVGDDLVLDLTGVTFMDSSGLGALVTSQRKFVQRRATLALAALQAPVARIFEMTMLDQTFDIHPTVPEAVTALQASR